MAPVRRTALSTSDRTSIAARALVSDDRARKADKGAYQHSSAHCTNQEQKRSPRVRTVNCSGEPGWGNAQMESTEAATRRPVAPIGVNHIVLNVRNMDESHQFWTEVVGLRLVGEFRQRPERPPTPRMRFYSGTRTAGVHHHDLALVENPNLPPLPIEWKMWDMPVAINHIAITYPSREAWLS